jgi:hypothetical protein
MWRRSTERVCTSCRRGWRSWWPVRGRSQHPRIRHPSCSRSPSACPVRPGGASTWPASTWPTASG